MVFGLLLASSSGCTVEHTTSALHSSQTPSQYLSATIHHHGRYQRPRTRKERPRSRVFLCVVQRCCSTCAARRRDGASPELRARESAMLEVRFAHVTHARAHVSLQYVSVYEACVACMLIFGRCSRQRQPRKRKDRWHGQGSWFHG